MVNSHETQPETTVPSEEGDTDMNRLTVMGEAELEKRSISGIYEHFRRDCNAAWRPGTTFTHGLLVGVVSRVAIFSARPE